MIISQKLKNLHYFYFKFVIRNISFKLSESLMELYESHVIWFSKVISLFFYLLKGRLLLFIVNTIRFRLKGRFFICWSNWNSWKSIFYKSHSPSIDPKKACWSNTVNEWRLVFKSFRMSSKRPLFVIKGAFGLLSQSITLPNIEINEFY